MSVNINFYRNRKVGNKMKRILTITIMLIITSTAVNAQGRIRTRPRSSHVHVRIHRPRSSYVRIHRPRPSYVRTYPRPIYYDSRYSSYRYGHRRHDSTAMKVAVVTRVIADIADMVSVVSNRHLSRR